MAQLGRILAVALALALWLVASGALAQRSAAARYQRIIRSAVAEFDAGHWGEARALFREAHELDPSARTLRGIGMCSFELREYGSAMRDLAAAVEHPRRPLTATQRRQVADLITRARAFVGRYRIRTDPEGATLSIDGAPPDPEPDGSVLLEIGRHELVATLDGYERTARVLTVEGGEEEPLVLELAREVPRVEVAHADDPVIAVPPPRSDVLSPIGLALMVGGGASLALGLVSIGWLVDRESELSLCDAAGSECLNRGTLASQYDAATAVVGTTIALGTVVMGAGIALFVIGESEHDDRALACVPGLLGLRCEGRF